MWKIHYVISQKPQGKNSFSVKFSGADGKDCSDSGIVGFDIS
jgi:hypothetical protein